MKQFLALFILTISLTTASIAPGYGQHTPEQHYFEWTSLPFPKEEYAQRREKMLRLQQEKKTIYLCPSRDGLSDGESYRQLDDFNYFTGLELPNAMLVINGASKEIILFTPDRDFRFESATRRNDFPGRPLGDDPVLKIKSGLTDIRSIEKLHSYIEEESNQSFVLAVNIGSPTPIAKLETDFITSWSPEVSLVHHLQRTFSSAKLENAYHDVGKLRIVKSELEIDALRKAADITVKGIEVAVKHIKPGVDERILEGEMEGEFKRQGSPRIPFASIIKSGPNSLWPWRILAAHYERRNRQMQAGELVIFDVGCEYKNYVSDMGRTFPVSGKFTDEQKQILLMETAVSDAIIAAIKPGITFADLKKVADAAIPESEKKYMQVGLFFGHHLGLSTGDPHDSQAPLAAGMVFTVEPWYYNHDKNISVFTEDEVLVTANGVEVLTDALPRTPEALEKMMN